MDGKFVLGATNPLRVVLEPLGGDCDIEFVELYVAYVTRSGLDDVCAVLGRRGVAGDRVRVLASADPFACDLGALAEVAEREGWSARWHPDPSGGRYHPKIYIAVSADGRAAVFVGSHNATWSAFNESIEAGALFSCRPTDPEFRTLYLPLMQLWDDGRQITEELAAAATRARRTGLGAAAIGMLDEDLATAVSVAHYLTRQAMLRSEVTPCLNALGESDTALDLALAFDYLRSVVGIDLPLSMCLEVVRRANLPAEQYGKIAADLHRAYQEVKRKASPLRPVLPWPDGWPPPVSPREVPDGAIAQKLQWLLQDPLRSPLTHSHGPARNEWAYTFDYLRTVCGIEIPWAVARDVLRRSSTSSDEPIWPPDTLRGAMRKSHLFDQFRREKGWTH